MSVEQLPSLKWFLKQSHPKLFSNLYNIEHNTDMKNHKNSYKTTRQNSGKKKNSEKITTKQQEHDNNKKYPKKNNAENIKNSYSKSNLENGPKKSKNYEREFKQISSFIPIDQDLHSDTTLSFNPQTNPSELLTWDTLNLQTCSDDILIPPIHTASLINNEHDPINYPMFFHSPPIPKRHPWQEDPHDEYFIQSLNNFDR